VSITHLTFSKEFTKAIEQKQVAEQDAERQMYVVQRADQERKVRSVTRRDARDTRQRDPYPLLCLSIS